MAVGEGRKVPWRDQGLMAALRQLEAKMLDLTDYQP